MVKSSSVFCRFRLFQRPSGSLSVVFQVGGKVCGSLMVFLGVRIFAQRFEILITHKSFFMDYCNPDFPTRDSFSDL